MLHCHLPLHCVDGVSLQALVAGTMPNGATHCHMPAKATHAVSHAKSAFPYCAFPFCNGIGIGGLHDIAQAVAAFSKVVPAGC